VLLDDTVLLGYTMLLIIFYLGDIVLLDDTVLLGDTVLLIIFTWVTSCCSSF